MHRRIKRLITVILPTIFLAFTSPAIGGETAVEITLQAQHECDQGRRVTSQDLRLAHFEKGQALAERAVALDDGLPEAHFALFCNLGEQLRDEEGLTSMFGFNRMMGELDRAVELNPDYLDALSAKASFLVLLPALFGGDEAKGEAILRRVIREEPQSVNARIFLARCLANRGNHKEALPIAAKALELAIHHDLQDMLPEAKQLLSDLESGNTSSWGQTLFVSF